ncbi:hypothetical protein FRC07_002944 [Ceratobasidium sp. 392]|nr:hypothetical protein FRC07_002944 [Ceratobasidium sp. 392]
MFSDKSLSAFPEFQALPVGLQAMILKLVRESRLNDHGCFKRPSNVWLLFRSDMFASFDDKTINQGDFSSSCQDAWNKMTDDQRANLQARADAEKTKLLELFPDYEYRPMTPDDKKIWSSMSVATKRSFWLAAVARIAERMMNPNGRWDGVLKLSGWIRDNMESSALTTSKRNATRGYGSDSTQPKASSSHTRAPHPYRQARDLASTRTPTQDRSGKLPKEFAQLAKSFLVRLKNKKESQKRRRPVLALFQPVDMCLYVEEELDEDIPDHVYNSLTLEYVPFALPSCYPAYALLN